MYVNIGTSNAESREKWHVFKRSWPKTTFFLNDMLCVCFEMMYCISFLETNYSEVVNQH